MPAAQVQEHLEAHKEILSQYAGLNFELMTHHPQRADVLRMIGAWIILHIELYDLSIKDYLPMPA